MARHLVTNHTVSEAIELQSDAVPSRLSKPELTKPLTEVDNANASSWRYRFGRRISLDGIETAMRLAEYGSMQRITDLSRETIDTDPHLAAVLNKRFGASSSLPYEVRPATGPNIDQEKARYYADCTRMMLHNLSGFRENIRQLAWAIFDGRAAQELIWRPMNNGTRHEEYGRVTMTVESINWIHPRRINFGPRRELRIYPSDGSYSGQFAEVGISLDTNDLKRTGLWRKFIQWAPSFFGEYAEREGIARRCLYYSFFKRYSARERMILLELFGKPWRILEVPDDSRASIEDLVAGDRIIDGLGRSYSARIPRGTKLDVVQPAKGSGEVHADVIKESDHQISKLVLGQIGTTDGVSAGMNSPQAHVMQGEQQVILQSDANDLSEIIERDLTDAFIEVNFGYKALTHAPNFLLRYDLPTDRKKEVERVDAALKAGLPVAMAEAYEVSGFRIPAETEPTIRIDQPPTPPTSPVAPAPRPVIVYPPNNSPPSGEQLPAPSVASADAGGRPPTATVGNQVVDKFVTVNEARESQDLPPLTLPSGEPDPDGDLTIMEFEAKKSHQPDVQESTVVEITDEKMMTALLSVASGNVMMMSERQSIALTDDQLLEWENTPFGSPEQIMRRGEKNLWRASGAWAREFESAVKGKDRPVEIYNALTRTQEELDLYSYSRPLERSMVQATALGVLDLANEIGFIDDDGELINLRGKGDQVLLIDTAFAETAFEKAMKWFRSLSLLPRAEFEKLTTELKRKTLTVAGIQSQQMLAVAQDELAKNIASGAPLNKFAAALDERFKSAGMVASDVSGTGTLSASHVQTVYRTNSANTYGVGRKTLQKQPAVLRAFPVWEFMPVDEPKRTRPTHLATKGMMLLASDPFWNSAYAPYGFNCRCRVSSRGPEYMDAVVPGSMILGLPDPGFVSGL